MLGVEPDASRQDIRRAYLRLARRSHPDVRGDDPGAAEQMRLINEAWAVLSGRGRTVAFAPRHTTAPGATAGSRGPTGAPASSSRAASDGGAYEAAAAAGDPAAVWRSGDAFDGDDTPLTGARLPTWMRLGAPALFVVGVFALILAIMTGLAVAVAAALISMAVSGLMFLIAPFVVLALSRRHPNPPAAPR